MRRGSRAPSMMFQIEAAAAIIAEAEAAMFLHETSTSNTFSNERCDTSHMVNRTNDIEPVTDTSANQTYFRSPSYTTLLGLQLEKSVNLP